MLRPVAPRAFTLLEMLVSMAVLSVVLTICGYFMTSIGRQAEFQQNANSVESDLSRTLEELTDLLRPAWIPDGQGGNENWINGLTGINLYTGSYSLRFLVPVDHDDDGDMLGTNMQIEWGCVRPDAPASPAPANTFKGQYLDMAHASSASAQKFYTTVAFVSTSPATYFSESSRNIDLNGDGDRTDTFELGRLEKQYPAGTVGTTNSTYYGGSLAAKSLSLTGNIVVKGDGNGDGSADPIFMLAGSTLKITLYMVKTDAETPLLIKGETTVNLGNQ